MHVQVEENAEPAAQAVSDQALRPAGKAVAENAEPMAKNITDGALRPAGQAVSDNAVPMTNSVMREQVHSLSLWHPDIALLACLISKVFTEQQHGVLECHAVSQWDSRSEGIAAAFICNPLHVPAYAPCED